MLRYRLAIKFYSLRKKRIFKAGIIFLLLLVFISSAYFFLQYRKGLNSFNSSSSQPATNETQEILEMVGKLMELPHETPTIATVTDVNKLEDQPFFAKAQNGDKVLIFSAAQRAIIYRPSTNKVIDITPIQTAPSASPALEEESVSTFTPSPTPSFQLNPTSSAPSPTPQL